MTDTVHVDELSSTKSKKNVPSFLATCSALCALSAGAVPFLPQLSPIYTLAGVIPSALLAFFAAMGFSKLRQEDRQRRMRLAKALERWQKEAQEQSKETERQSKLRQLIALDLQKEKEIAQNYLDVANIFLAAIDSDGLVEVINRKGIEILGCQERDILGEDFAKFCVPDPYREKVAGELTMALKGHKQILSRTEYPISTAQGERLISWSNALVKDASGKSKAILLCGEDVTDRRSVEARLQLMRMMLESVDEGVIAFLIIPFEVFGHKNIFLSITM